MAYTRRYGGGFVNKPTLTTPIDATFLNNVENALLALWAVDAVGVQLPIWNAANARYEPGAITNAHIDAAAAIAQSKLALAITDAQIAAGANIAVSKIAGLYAPTKQIFTTGSGTYTTPSACRLIVVECLGGGASGGQGQTGSSTGTCVGSGGNGGQYSIKFIANPLATYAYAVGAGGAAIAGGGNWSVGNNGGDSTFGSTVVVAKGGVGGQKDGQTGHAGPWITQPQAQAAGGVGDILAWGRYGDPGKIISNGGWSEGGAGGGGGGPFGGPGALVAASGTGANTAGNAPQAGALGAGSSGSIAGPFSGGAVGVGAGNPGIIVVREFY